MSLGCLAALASSGCGSSTRTVTQTTTVADAADSATSTTTTTTSSRPSPVADEAQIRRVAWAFATAYNAGDAVKVCDTMTATLQAQTIESTHQISPDAKTCVQAITADRALQAHAPLPHLEHIIVNGDRASATDTAPGADPEDRDRRFARVAGEWKNAP